MFVGEEKGARAWQGEAVGVSVGAGERVEDMESAVE